MFLAIPLFMHLHSLMLKLTIKETYLTEISFYMYVVYKTNSVTVRLMPWNYTVSCYNSNELSSAWPRFMDVNYALDHERGETFYFTVLCLFCE
jgi:hypothetical protein